MHPVKLVRENIDVSDLWLQRDFEGELNRCFHVSTEAAFHAEKGFVCASANTKDVRASNYIMSLDDEDSLDVS